jgi:hypothetical protein
MHDHDAWPTMNIVKHVGTVNVITNVVERLRVSLRLPSKKVRLVDDGQGRHMRKRLSGTCCKTTLGHQVHIELSGQVRKVLNNVVRQAIALWRQWREQVKTPTLAHLTNCIGENKSLKGQFGLLSA